MVIYRRLWLRAITMASIRSDSIRQIYRASHGFSDYCLAQQRRQWRWWFLLGSMVAVGACWIESGFAWSSDGAGAMTKLDLGGTPKSPMETRQRWKLGDVAGIIYICIWIIYVYILYFLFYFNFYSLKIDILILFSMTINNKYSQV